MNADSETAELKWIRAVSLGTIHSSSKPAQLSWTHGFSLKEEREECTMCQCSGFLEGYLRDWFLSLLTWSAKGTSTVWMPGKYWHEWEWEWLAAGLQCYRLRLVQLSTMERRQASHGLSLGKKGQERSVHPTYQLFREAPMERYLSHLIQKADRNLHTSYA